MCQASYIYAILRLDHQKIKLVQQGDRSYSLMGGARPNYVALCTSYPSPPDLNVDDYWAQTGLSPPAGYHYKL